jgi:hypothetical protein
MCAFQLLPANCLSKTDDDAGSTAAVVVVVVVVVVVFILRILSRLKRFMPD